MLYRVWFAVYVRRGGDFATIDLSFVRALVRAFARALVSLPVSSPPPPPPPPPPPLSLSLSFCLSLQHVSLPFPPSVTDAASLNFVNDH